MLAICLPYINTFLEDVTEGLAEFENHRTQDNFDISLTQKRFVLAFIANYLPILLTAFVYIPLGDSKSGLLFYSHAMKVPPVNGCAFLFTEGREAKGQWARFDDIRK